MSPTPQARIRLGRTSLYVTRLGLGTAPLGNLYEPVPEKQALGTVRRALDLGIRLLDTAPLYGYGEAERRIGLALSELGAGVPEDLVLATKVGRLLRKGAPPDPSQIRDGAPIYASSSNLNPVFDWSAEGIRRSLEESLVRLGRDRVDIVHLHDPDDHLDSALRDAYPVLERWRQEGVVGAIGAGMNHAGALARLLREADLDCVLVAGRYSLIDQSALDELLPLCASRGVAVIVGGVFNSGILADPRPGARYDYGLADAERLERAGRLQEVCSHHGVPLKAAALQFPLGHPAITCALVGARSPAEVEENLELAGRPLPAALWQELRVEGLIPDEAPVPGEPGPGGPGWSQTGHD
jgi:D-threo-aldose 1-dehydrogenase